MIISVVVSVPLVVPMLAVVSLLVAFVRFEHRTDHPLLPLLVVADRTRGVAFAVVGIAGVAMFGLFLFLTHYLQSVLHFSPVMSGLAFLPMIACVMISSNTSNIVTLTLFRLGIVITTGMVLGSTEFDRKTSGWRQRQSARCSKSAARSERRC